MIRNWTKKHYYLLIGTGLVASFIYLTGYVYMIKPISAELVSTKQQATMFEKQLSRFSLLDEHDKEMTEINEQIPIGNSLDTLLHQLNQFAGRTKVNIYFIESHTSEEKQAEEELTFIKDNEFLLEATSTDMNHMLAFLKEIETGNPLMVINEVDIDHTSNDVTASILFTTYYQAN